MADDPRDKDKILEIVAVWYQAVNDGLGMDASDLVGDLEEAGFALPEIENVD